jgi:alpha-ketoglutaric semialdehyde dehydrogenase
MDPEFRTVDASQIDQACRLAEEAFDTFRALSDEQRAVFLETVGDQIMELGDVLVERVMAETGLPRPRLEGERGRTVGQLKLFANLLREGSWNDVRIDKALPERTPPRPDLRMRMIGLGPWPSSLPVISRWRFLWPVATPHRRLPPAARWC